MSLPDFESGNRFEDSANLEYLRTRSRFLYGLMRDIASMENDSVAMDVYTQYKRVNEMLENQDFDDETKKFLLSIAEEYDMPTAMVALLWGIGYETQRIVNSDARAYVYRQIDNSDAFIELLAFEAGVPSDDEYLMEDFDEQVQELFEVGEAICIDHGNGKLDWEEIQKRMARVILYGNSFSNLN